VILRHRSTAPLAVLALLAALLTLVAAGCGGDSASGSGGGSGLTLVGYSVAREVNSDLITAFQATPAGEGVSFNESYAASGEQSRAVEAGQKADYVVFSLEPDMTRLVDAGLVDEDWNAGPTKGMVSDSVVVFITRERNPKGIRTWNDLAEDGVEVITPNPFTSGAAQWNIVAAYQSQIDQGATPDEALAYVDALFANVPVQPASGREALQVFDSGQGDVLLSYENEAIAAQAAGDDIDYVVPDQNLLIENPAAVVKTGDVRAAQAYLDFVLSPAGQKILGEHGYRPVVKSVAAQFDFPAPSDLSTIADLGGWAKVKSDFFDRENGAITKIFEGQGIATE
jgi:sulfate transport system substrate-binding protein